MEKIKLLTSNIHDAFFNLASEEYLLKQKGGYYVYIWKNAPSVIVGVNQNTLLEVNLPLAEEKGIKIVRRLTGGGAVYHDLENVNYTVIAPYNKDVNNYLEFCTPVIKYLNSLGVNAEFSGRNDICIDGKKISGNAQTVYNGKIMHHGTLLFNTDMSILGDVLIQNKLKVESKGVKSIRARVTNIHNELKTDMTVDEFMEGLIKFLNKNYEEYSFSEEDLTAINKLVKEKYSTYEWNIGCSPLGKNRFDGRFAFGTITITFNLNKGLVESAQIYGDFFSKKDIKEFSNKLNGIPFKKEDFIKAFELLGDYIVNADGANVVEKIFEV